MTTLNQFSRRSRDESPDWVKPVAGKFPARSVKGGVFFYRQCFSTSPRGGLFNYMSTIHPSMNAGKQHRLYRTWLNMRGRCKNRNLPNWKRYGGRGILVCKSWDESFQAFAEWAYASGYANNLTIDRINNDGNYEPSNCRWLTLSDNIKNRPISEHQRIGNPGIHVYVQKKVQCVETGVIFESYTKAAHFAGVRVQCIHNAVKRSRKSKGFHWKLA